MKSTTQPLTSVRDLLLEAASCLQSLRGDPHLVAKARLVAARLGSEPHSEDFDLPAAVLVMEHQSGAILSEAQAGATLTLHWRGGPFPVSAELYSADESHYAEIGLWWDEHGALTDYDGVFSLPKEVIDTLRAEGFNVPDDMR